MGELYTAIEIQAPTERVWRLLTDFERYPSWNPFLISVEGTLEPGARLKVTAQPSGSMRRTFFPRVLKVDPDREFRWLGRLLLPGLLDGEHIFTIEPLEAGRVRLVHREEFNGLIVPVHRRLRFGHTRRGFEEMNLALKARAEQPAGADHSAP